MLVEWLAKIRHPSSSWRTSMICLLPPTSESALKTLMTALSAHVKVRETGRVGLKGGHLRFLGRSIFRRPGSSTLYMQVDPTYLDEAFAEFDLKKGSTTFSDLRPILEQKEANHCQQKDMHVFAEF